MTIRGAALQPLTCIHDYTFNYTYHIHHFYILHIHIYICILCGRNAAYAEALQALRAPEVVLDLGAGTGLLAALCCKAHGCRAVACEVYDQCAQVARQVLMENGLGDRVKVVNKVASDLEARSTQEYKMYVILYIYDILYICVY